MANEFLSSMTANTPKTTGYAIAPGTVTNNLDGIAEGRVQVHLSSRPSFDPWARIAAVGGGSGRGFLWVPQIDDEVLVAFNQNDERDAYILGGLWSTLDRPPLIASPEFLVKRKIKTGMAGGIGHEIEFDDSLQSITITSSTKQKITIDPTKIELTNLAGTVKISLDNTTQSITIQAVKSIDLKAAQINLQAVNIDLKGTALTNIAAPLVKIN